VKNTSQKPPKARAAGLLVQELTDEVLVYDLERHKAHCLNTTAALVWKSCDGHRSVADIARQLREQTGEKVDEALVLFGLDQLEKAKLLSAPSISNRTGLPRREALRKIGLAAVMALPIVTSIVAPRAAEAGTCRASGQSCTTSLQCCSGLCSGNACA
jgi:coenzyme PQQ synthesis protein D (PqqD)